MIDILLSLTLLAAAQDMHHGHHDMPAAAETETAAQSTTFADVRSVDTEGRTALLRHGPLPELGMMGMVMSFHIADDVDITLFEPGAALTVTVSRHGEDLMVIAAAPEEA